MDKNTFSYLVIGIAQLLEKQHNNPYPDPLRYSLNKLSLEMLSDFPKTMNGLLQMLEQPLAQWWRGDFPPKFGCNESLIEEKMLSAEAVAYLDYLSDEGNETYQQSLKDIGILIDNHKFKDLLERLRQKEATDREGVQSAYVKLRRFLIENPYAKLTEISQTFANEKYIPDEEVQDLYIKASDLKDQRLYQEKYWLCEHCGPLEVTYGKLCSIKCGNHCPVYQQGWQPVEPSRQLRLLRKGLHLRIHMPGIVEINLFKWLKEQRAKYPQYLLEVQLWPNLDRYDLHLQFSDSEAWAVDLKDYQKPESLGRKLKLTPLYGQDVSWQSGFYVYPAYREQQRSDYGDVVRAEVGSSLKAIQILSDQTFKDRVLCKLKTLKQDKN